MHCQVGAAFLEGGLEFLDEQSLAADLGQCAVENLVAARGHAEQVHGAAQALCEQVANMLCLPQGEAAFAGGDGQ